MRARARQASTCAREHPKTGRPGPGPTTRVPARPARRARAQRTESAGPTTVQAAPRAAEQLASAPPMKVRVVARTHSVPVGASPTSAQEAPRAVTRPTMAQVQPREEAAAERRPTLVQQVTPAQERMAWAHPKSARERAVRKAAVVRKRVARPERHRVRPKPEPGCRPTNHPRPALEQADPSSPWAARSRSERRPRSV